MIQEGNSKKEPLTAVVISSAPKLIRVVAPTNLPGGYQLEVQTDNDPPTAFTATVPSSGVKAGDVFLTPPPPGYIAPNQLTEAPVGRWKDGVFDCFKNGICFSQTWLSLFCQEIALGQIMHRFRLTWRGDLIESHSPVNTFKTVLTIALSYLVFDTALGVLIEYNFNDNAQVQTPLVAIVANVKTFVGLLMTFWFIYALYKTRKRVRETYSIPEQTCTGCEDCMCATFCGCCTVAQIARHTGEYEKYPSFCCTETGLPESAPMAA